MIFLAAVFAALASISFYAATGNAVLTITVGSSFSALICLCHATARLIVEEIVKRRF